MAQRRWLPKGEEATKWEVRRVWPCDLQPDQSTEAPRPDQSPATYDSTKAPKHHVQTKEAPQLDQNPAAYDPTKASRQNSEKRGISPSG